MVFASSGFSRGENSHFLIEVKEVSFYPQLYKYLLHM